MNNINIDIRYIIMSIYIHSSSNDFSMFLFFISVLNRFFRINGIVFGKDIFCTS